MGAKPHDARQVVRHQVGIEVNGALSLWGWIDL
jgi:hypothetical protein